MLKAEVATKQGSLTILRDLETLLRPFRKEYDVPLNVVIAFVEPRAIPIKRAAESIGFEPSSEPVVSCQVFATSTPGTVEVWFVSVQPFHDTSEQARTTEGLRIDGRGLYDSRDGRLRDVALNHERLHYTDIDGRKKAVPGSVVYGYPEPLYIGGPPKIEFDRLDLINPR